MSSRKIYNVNASDSFVDVLARTFLNEYKDKEANSLSDVLFLLPNRRACRDLADAFVRANGLEPTILPRIEPIAEASEDEILLSGNGDLARHLPPAIGTTERLLRLMRQILRYDEKLGVKDITPAQAYDLAQNLAVLLDTVYQQNIDMDKLDSLLDDSSSYAEHWQRTLKLLDVIRRRWPEILQEQQKVDAVERRNMLLKAELEYWRQTKTEQRIVIAGTTAAFPLLKELVKTVADLPNGEVWLYGLDTYLSDSDWQKIEVSHPQYELKELLGYLNEKRETVKNIGVKNLRQNLISECMRPAVTTDKWLDLRQRQELKESLQNIHIVECDDMRQEAYAIALIIRDVLRQSQKTVALVTPDRNLARRVVSELKRWNVKADDSAGLPLSLSPIGIYLRLIAEVVESHFSQTSCLALLKHPLTACGLERKECLRLIRRIELYWRGSRKMKEGLGEEEQNLLEDLHLRLQPLVELYGKSKISLQQMLITHIQVAEILADTAQKSGEKIIWKQDDGHTAADFISDLTANSSVFEYIAPRDYAKLFTKLIQAQNVRVRYGMHPRVKILGPIEARMTQFDVTIVGEANEGFWPQQPPSDMWMSRQMRADFGLPDAERAVGVTAADFAHLLNAPEVYITRSQRMDGTPTAKSRWMLRLETILTALLGSKKQIYSLYDMYYSALAKYDERAQNTVNIAPPAPRPAIDKRPLELSATNINAFLRDPYTIFAKYILQLYPLEDIDRNFDRRDYGTLVHKAVELFNKKYGAHYPINAKEELLKLGEELFSKASIPTEVRVFWWPQFEQTVDWLLNKEQEYRIDIVEVYNEEKGKMHISLSDGHKFTITGTADRIDVTENGDINILDYKTGSSGFPASLQLFKLGYEPQLPVEALIAMNDGYEKIKAPVKINSLRCWRLGKEVCELSEDDSKIAIGITEQNLRQRLHEFYEQTPPAPYVYKPDPASAPKYSDYEHLSRYAEWAIKDDVAED